MQREMPRRSCQSTGRQDRVSQAAPNDASEQKMAGVLCGLMSPGSGGAPRGNKPPAGAGEGLRGKTSGFRLRSGVLLR